MKQILQSLKTGETEIADIPCPKASAGHLLVRTHQTLVSAGTERMLVEFGKANWFDKARQQPDKVRMVLDKIKTDGIAPTLEAVLRKLDQPLPLGYCNVGTVIEVGAGVTGFEIGDRIVSNGKHAEVVNVPVNLAAKVPEQLPDEAAVFTVLGAIALQGIRLIQPTLGETVVVTGLGLIGLMAVQLLKAQGCRVLGIDFDAERLKQASSYGAEIVALNQKQDPVAVAQQFSRGRGVDAVLITAATNSNEPMHQAAQMCRKRGRIVLVGVTGLALSRADFFEKELTFQVSCSYGPGRYDSNYEEKGQDYPFAFVRWTEQRNFEAVLDMMAEGKLNCDALISHRYQLAQAEEAYSLVASQEPSLGIVLQYPVEIQSQETLKQSTIFLNGFDTGPQPVLAQPALAKPVLGMIGAGNYSTAVLIPAFKTANARLKSIASAGGVSGYYAGKKYGFEATTTDANQILQDKAIDVIAITTRHNSHAHYVQQALEKGKHVFVEKPLCLTLDELERIAQIHEQNRGLLMVGFNRRFSPLITQIKSLLHSSSEPKSLIMTVNAGSIPEDHWTQDVQVGGGRLIGEACHFVDLMRFLVGTPIMEKTLHVMQSKTKDTLTITLHFFDGSIGTVHYFANGHKQVAKERLEIFSAGKVLQLDNFRSIRGAGFSGFKKHALWRQDKGQKHCVKAFIEAIEAGNPSPIAFEELYEVSRTVIELAQMQ